MREMSRIAGFGKIGLVLIGLVVGLTVGNMFFLILMNRLDFIEDRALVEVGGQFIIVDVAMSEKVREQGLSGRDELGVNEGMLFMFDEFGKHSFWMKGMKFPIDIVWINGESVVGFEENVPVPDDQYVEDAAFELYYPPEEVDKVLELSAGRVELLRVEVGDVVGVKPFVGNEE